MTLELKVPGFARLDEYVGLWLCEESAFRLHWEAAQRLDISHFQAEQPPLKSQMELVQGRNGKSVAVIPILGVMMKQRSSMGGTSTIQIRRDIRNAAADPNVSGILLAIESPGGTTAGLDDLAADVRAARKQKPVFAHVDDLTASAAYWIASQADQITANAPTALVGSIGTILTVYDQSAAAEQQGVKTLVFATGPLKGAGTPGSKVTEEQINYFQGLVNGIQQEFDAAVKKGRRLTQKQLEDVRSGAVWKAAEAQARGLIDGIQPLSKTLDQLTRQEPTKAIASGTPPVAAFAHLPALQTGALEKPMDFSAWLAANVPNHEDLSDEQRDNLRAAWKLTNTPAPPPVAVLAPEQPKHESMEVVLAKAKANEERKNAITALMAEYITERPETIPLAEALGREAIEKHWTVDKFKLEYLTQGRNIYGNGGRINLISSGQPEATGDILEAAICKTGRLESIDKHYSDRTLSATDKLFKGGLGIQDLIMHVARRNGCRAHSFKGNERAVLKAAFSEQYDLRAEMGPSTYSLPNILANVANKFVKAGFMAVDQTWRALTAIRSVSDFKAISSFSLTGDNTYEQVAPGGELKHGSLGEVAYSNQANTYGKILGIDRRDLINDDTGALTGASRRLGRGGALKLNDVFWTAFLNNSSFFTTGRGNADSGNDTLMDLTGIANAWNLFQLQTDPDSKPLAIRPAIMLVPPALWPAAWTLTMSTTLNLATSNAASTGTSSPWTGMFRLFTSPYLANSAFTGYSAAAWYLLADPNDMPVIETAFLNGVESPTVETADMDFDRLGIAIRGYYDFGVALQEYRGGVRMAGA